MTSAELLFKLTAPEPQLAAHFGETLAVADGDILIGEPLYWEGNEPYVGQAHLFDGQSGQLEMTYRNPRPMREDQFGAALAGGDGRVFVSGSGLNNENRVYVYDKGSGDVLHEIESPLTRFEGFGSALAYGHGTLLVSSPSFSAVGQQFPIGRAHLFSAESGDLIRTVPNPEPKQVDGFATGASVAVLSNKVIIGAMLNDLPNDTRPDGDNPGRVWVLNRENGEVAFTLENPNPESRFFDWFGWTVAANEEFIVVGAREDATSGAEGAGTVYVFDTDSGQLLHTLFSPQNQEAGEFGRAVALTPSGDVVVGAWATNVGDVERAGRAYLFDGETGSLLLDIPNPEPSLSADFGWSVAAIENLIIVGARDATVNGNLSAGAVYVFEIIPEPSGFVMCLSAATIVTSLRRNRRSNFRRIDSRFFS
jgi:hypothetical protein